MNTYKKQQLAIAITTLSTLLIGCTNEPESTKPVSTQSETSSETPNNRIDIPTRVRKNLGITFANVERRHVERTIRVPGSFETLPLARHEYRMTLPGQVDLMVDQYQRVEPGDVLFRFKSPDWPELQHEIIVGEQEIDAANANIQVTRSAFNEAESRLQIIRDRLSSLKNADIRNADLEMQASEIEASIPRLQAEIIQSETALINAQKTHEHAMHRAAAITGLSEELLNSDTIENEVSTPTYRTIDWIEVHAIEAGIIETLAVTDGAFAQAPSLVISTLDPSKLRFRATALQSDLILISQDARARIVPPTNPGLSINSAIDADLMIGIEAQPEDRTMTIFAHPESNQEWFRPGISAFLEIVTDSSGSPALAIPQSAIVKDGVNHVFFRRDPNDPNKAIRVEADLGASDGRWTAINSGISLNDQIVLNGAYELRLASQQSGTMQKGGHFHADGTFHEEGED